MTALEMVRRSQGQQDIWTWKSRSVGVWGMTGDSHHAGTDVLNVVKRTVTSAECTSPLTHLLLRPTVKLIREPCESLESQDQSQKHKAQPQGSAQTTYGSDLLHVGYCLHF